MAGFFVGILVVILLIFSRQDKVKKIPLILLARFFNLYFIKLFSYFFYTIQTELLVLLGKLIYY
jgi:hypothetical protein